MYKNIILIFILFMVLSCQDSKQKFDGFWQCGNCFENSNSYTDVFLIKLNKDTIDIVNGEGFRTQYRMELFNDRFFIHTDSKTLSYKVDQISDSILMINNKRYYRLDKDIISHYTIYDLKKIEVENQDLALPTNSDLFSMYKEGGELIFQLNDSHTRNIKDLNDFLGYGHFNNESVAIKIGKDITMKELLLVYAEINFRDISKVYLLFSRGLNEPNIMLYDELYMSDKLKNEYLFLKRKKFHQNRIQF